MPENVSKINEQAKELLLDISFQMLKIPTSPFKEQLIIDYVISFVQELGLSYNQDAMGNIIVEAGKGQETNAVFQSHLDHPGFIAESETDGILKARFYGGVDEVYFKEGTPVEFFTDSGVVSGTVLSIDFSQKAQRIKYVYIKPAKAGAIKPRTMGMWQLGDVELKGDILYSRACDDLVGTVAILALMRLRANLPGKFKCVFTLAEEAGLNGALYVCEQKQLPHQANIYSVETSCTRAGAPIGGGAVIRVGDARSVFDNGLIRFLTNIATQIQKTEPEFKFQRKLMDGGCCESTIFQLAGYRSAALCVALGNYHNRNFDKQVIEQEYISITDLVGILRLFYGVIEQNNSIASFTEPKFVVDFSRGELGEQFCKLRQ